MPLAEAVHNSHLAEERMGNRAACDILVVGNYCHDTIVDRAGARHEVLGGSAAYMAAVLTAFGLGFRVVAKVGRDFRYAEQVAQPPQAPIVEGARTTAFLGDYHLGERRERLCAPGPRIRQQDVEIDCEVAIACAVAGEVLPETLAALRRRCRLLLADAQGLSRTFGADGAISIGPIGRSPWASSLPLLDHLKVGGAERASVGPHELRGALVVTLGASGCLVRLPPGADGARAEVAVAAEPAREIDATGAGDCFLAGYAAGLFAGLSPVQAARVGVVCGARAVEQVGVPRFPPGALAALLRPPARAEDGASHA
jgi:1D-myo-inositol 3-kinase